MAELEIYDDRIDAALAKPPFAAFCRLHGQNGETDAASNSTTPAALAARYGALPRMPFMKRLEPLLAYLQLLHRGQLKALCGGDPSGRPQKLSAPAFSHSNPPSDFFRTLFDASGLNSAASASRMPASPVKKITGPSDDSDEIARIRNRQKRWGDTGGDTSNDGLNDADESDGDTEEDASFSARKQASSPTTSTNRISSSPIASAAESLLKKPFELLSVEPYRRSDAGAEINRSVLRTPVALEKTMHFLVQHYMRVPHTPLVYLYAHDVWRYLWDRLRQVRTNWVPQLTAVESILQLDDGVADTQRTLLQMSGGGNNLEPSPAALNSPLGKCYQDLLREKQESWRRLRWLEFTVAALSVQSVILCRTREGCVQFMNDKRNFLESIAQSVSDLILAYRAMASPSAPTAPGEDHVARHSEFFSVLTLFYGLKQTEKVENFARFCVKVSFSGGKTAFEQPSESTNIASVYSELQLVPEMATTKHVRTALRFIHCCTQREWFTFMFLCRFESLTVLQRATLFQSFSYVRFRAIADLVTANEFLSSFCRVRGDLSIATLTDLLLFCSEEDCMLFIKHMGLQELLFKSTTPPQEIHRGADPTTTTTTKEEYWYLRLCDREKPLTTPEAILSYMEKNQTKPQLLLPVVPEFMGFSPCQEDLERLNRQVYEDLSASLDGASAQSLMRDASRSPPPLSASVRDASCPVNLMTLLEPYCPAYNEDVENLVLTDAGQRYFKDIQQSREHFLRLSVQQHRVYDTWRAGCIARFHPQVPQTHVQREWDPDEFVRVHLHTDHPQLPTWLRNAVYDVFDLGIQQRDAPITAAPANDEEMVKMWQDRQRLLQLQKERAQEQERVRAAEKEAEKSRMNLAAEAEALQKQKAAAEAAEKQRKEREEAEAKRVLEKKAEEERLEMAKRRQREEDEAAAELVRKQQRLQQLRDLQRKQQIEEENARKAAEVAQVVRGAMQAITGLKGLAYYEQVASRGTAADNNSEKSSSEEHPPHTTSQAGTSPLPTASPSSAEATARETIHGEARNESEDKEKSASITHSADEHIPPQTKATPPQLPPTTPTDAAAVHATSAKSSATEIEESRGRTAAPDASSSTSTLATSAPAEPPVKTRHDELTSKSSVAPATLPSRLPVQQPLGETIAKVINGLLVNDSATGNEPQSNQLQTNASGDLGNRSGDLTLPVEEVDENEERRAAAATENTVDEEDEEAATSSATIHSRSLSSEKSTTRVEPTGGLRAQRPFAFISTWLQPGIPKRPREEEEYESGSSGVIAKRARWEEGRGGTFGQRGTAEEKRSYINVILTAAKQAGEYSAPCADLRLAQFFTSYYLEDAVDALLRPRGLPCDTHSRASSRNLPSGPEWSASTHQTAKSVEFLTLLTGYAYHEALWHRILAGTPRARHSQLSQAIEDGYADAAKAGETIPRVRNGRGAYDSVVGGRVEYVRRLAQLCPGFVPRGILTPTSHSYEEGTAAALNDSTLSGGFDSMISMDASLVLVVPATPDIYCGETVLLRDLAERLSRMITGELTPIDANFERQIFAARTFTAEPEGTNAFTSVSMEHSFDSTPPTPRGEGRTAAGGMSLAQSLLDTTDMSFLRGTSVSPSRSPAHQFRLNSAKAPGCAVHTTVTLLMKNLTDLLAADFLRVLPTNATIVLPMLWRSNSPSPALELLKAICRGKYGDGGKLSPNDEDGEDEQLLSSTSSVSGTVVFLMTESSAEDEEAVRSVYASVDESVRLRARDELYRNSTSSAVESSSYTRATAQLLQKDDTLHEGRHQRGAPSMNRYSAILERLTHSIPRKPPHVSTSSQRVRAPSPNRTRAPMQSSSKCLGMTAPPPCVVVVPIQTIIADCVERSCNAEALHSARWSAMCDEAVRYAFINALQSLSDMYAARRMGKTDIVTPHGWY